MKKKLYFSVMLLLAIVGTARATTVTIGTGTGTSNALPVNLFYNYSLTQQIYLADEIGMAGAITAISFYYTYTASFSLPDIRVYMKHVDKNFFSDNTDMESVGSADLVWSGTFSASGTGWVTITLDKPFAYNGTSNLLLCFYDQTSGYPGSAYTFQVSDGPGDTQLRYYSDSSCPDLNDLSGYSGSKYLTNTRSNIKLYITSPNYTFENAFTPSEFENDSEYPWEVVSMPSFSGYGGSYCLRSGNAGHAGTTSSIEATVYFGSAGTVSFLGGCWGEGSAYDVSKFYIDGVQQFSYGSLQRWNSYAFNVSAGTHTFKWSYTKDNSVNPLGDFFAIDNLTFIGMGFGSSGTVSDFYFTGYTVPEYGAHPDCSIMAPIGAPYYVSEVYWKLCYPESNSIIPLTEDDIFCMSKPYNVCVRYKLRPGFTRGSNRHYYFNGVSGYYFDGTSTDCYYVHSPLTYVTPPSGTIVDFETGDFTQHSVTNNGTYPWVVADVPYALQRSHGSYAIQSGNAGVANSSSTIQMSHTFSAAGYISFDANCQGEGYSYDVCAFYIDGEEQFAYGNNVSDWHNYVFEVSSGTHTFKWSYTKDSSVNPTGDRFVLDNIVFATGTCCQTPRNLEVHPALGSATVSWEGYGDSYNVRYRPATTDFTETFDNGMQNWTTIDADGDGYNWMLGSEELGNYGYGHYGSRDFVISQSYRNGEGALTPDNYLVSPLLRLGDTLHFWACAQDASWPDEHFGVAVSTAGNSNADNFTTIQEFTLSAKGSGAPTSVTRSGNRAQGNWHLYTVDLSAYNGQMGYVAFRHFNCTDIFWLDIDDVSFTSPYDGTPWTTLTTNSPSVTLNDLIHGVCYEVQVSSPCNGEWTSATFVTPTMPTSTANWYGFVTYSLDGASYEDAYIQFSMQDPASVSAATSVQSFNTYAASYANGEVWCITTVGDLLKAALDDRNKSIGSFETVVEDFVSGSAAPIAMAYNFADGRMYYIENDGNVTTLKSFDPMTPVRGEGIETNIELQTLAINKSGVAYGIAYQTGYLYRINLSTGALTFVGNTGQNVAYVQSMAFDMETDELFWAQICSSTDVGLYKVNPVTAATSFLGQIGGGSGVELTGLFMAYPCGSGSNIVDFETGDFSQLVFHNDADYPWTVVSASNGSSYCMKSGNAGVHSSTSAITAMVYYPVDGKISFRLWSRGQGTDANDYDNSRFYIDGVRKFRYGKHNAWENYSVEVPAGLHTFKWEYKKNASTHPTGDCFMVDNIAFSAPIEDHTITLQNGWNWFSSYIEYSSDALPWMEQNIASSSNVGIIKTPVQFVSLNADGTWTGGLTGLDNEQMYAIQSGSVVVHFRGSIAKPSSHPITLTNGWNWIPFLSSEPMALSEALAGITPAAGDLIKDMSNSSTYNPSSGWTGGLNTLIPGKGYMYSHSGSSMTLVYPASSKGVVVEPAVEKHWNHNPHRFPTNLTMMVTLDAEQFDMDEGSHEIGAFVGGECRGSARLQKVDSEYIAFLTVSGALDDEVCFKLFDVAENREYPAAANERISYTSDAIYGSVSEPMTLHFGNTGVDEYGGISLYPNPTNDKVFIQGHDLVSVKVYNAMGQLVLTEDCGHADLFELNLGSLSDGVYTAAITLTEGKTAVKRIIKK